MTNDTPKPEPQAERALSVGEALARLKARGSIPLERESSMSESLHDLGTRPADRSGRPIGIVGTAGKPPKTT